MPLLINGELVPDFLIKQEAEALRPFLLREMEGEDPGEIETRLVEWSRDNVIERVLLRQVAMESGEPVPTEVLQTLTKKASEVEIRIAQVIFNIHAGVPPPAKEEMAACPADEDRARIRESLHARAKDLALAHFLDALRAASDIRTLDV